MRICLGMEESDGNSEASRASSDTSTAHSRGREIYTSSSNILRSPLSSLLEYSGILRTGSVNSGLDVFPNAETNFGYNDHHLQMNLNDAATPSPVSSDRSIGEVSIRISGAGEHEHGSIFSTPAASQLSAQEEPFAQPISRPGNGVPMVSSLEQIDLRGDRENGMANVGDFSGSGQEVVRDSLSSYQRHDIHQAAQLIEQVLPFSLLLLVVFIRQHLQGFCVTIWAAAFMFKSNEIVRKQTALRGERKIYVLLGIAIFSTLHVLGIYWWYHNDDLLYPLSMLPPTSIPVFWNAVFIIMVNDILVRQAAMVFKCVLLMCHKCGRNQSYRKQGQVLTLIEYLLLLYRTLIPAPVWYRFFLNKEYGTLFSSIMTGLYLTFKLTSVVEKVQTFITSLKALTRKDVHYGTYATSEQVMAAGDLCAICQEKMHLPVLLRCQHIFCEDCVSEWFERERTCPLCRASVKPSDLKSFGDGSTSLFFQLF